MLLTPKSLLIPCRSLKKPCRSFERPCLFQSWGLVVWSFTGQAQALPVAGQFIRVLKTGLWRAQLSRDEGIDRGSKIWNLPNKFLF